MSEELLWWRQLRNQLPTLPETDKELLSDEAWDRLVYRCRAIVLVAVRRAAERPAVSALLSSALSRLAAGARGAVLPHSAFEDLQAEARIASDALLQESNIDWAAARAVAEASGPASDDTGRLEPEAILPGWSTSTCWTLKCAAAAAVSRRSTYATRAEESRAFYARFGRKFDLALRLALLAEWAPGDAQAFAMLRQPPYGPLADYLQERGVDDRVVEIVTRDRPHARKVAAA